MSTLRKPRARSASEGLIYCRRRGWPIGLCNRARQGVTERIERRRPKSFFVAHGRAPGAFVRSHGRDSSGGLLHHPLDGRLTVTRNSQFRRPFPIYCVETSARRPASCGRATEPVSPSSQFPLEETQTFGGPRHQTYTANDSREYLTVTSAIPLVGLIR
jgi:hypothetical protein